MTYIVYVTERGKMRIIIPIILWLNHPFTISETIRQMPKTRTMTHRILVQRLPLASLITMLSLPFELPHGFAVYLVVNILKAAK